MRGGQDGSNWTIVNHFSNSSPTLSPGDHPSAKSSVDIKGYKVSYDVIARPRQFMGNSLPRDHQVSLRWFPLVKPLHCWIETERKLGHFHVGPLEIRMAIVDVALTFPLNSGDAHRG